MKTINKIHWPKVLGSSMILLFWTILYGVLTNDLTLGMCVISVSIIPVFVIIVFFCNNPEKNWIKCVKYIEMAEVYQMTPREHVDELLRFNQEICRYCRYESSKGAIFFLDLSHLETMDFVKTTVGTSILMRIKEWSMQAGNPTGTACVFLQRDISYLSFRA